MIEQAGRVVALQGDCAEITTRQQSACGTCDARGGCGTSLLAAWFPRRELRFHVRNDIGARPGDEVIIGLDERRLQRGSLLLYALPLAGLLIGAVAGERAFGLVGLPPELGAVLAGLLGLGAALLLVRQRTGGPTGDHGGLKLLRVSSRSTSLTLGRIGLPGANQP